MTKYTYSVASDTANAAVDLNALTAEIQASAIVTSLNHIDLLGDVLDVWFNADLAAGDVTILNGLVAAHDGVPLADNNHADVEIINEPRFEFTSKYFKKAVAARGDCAVDTTTNLDLLIDNIPGESSVITDEAYTQKYLKGGILMAEGSGAQRGDHCKFQVIDKDGWLVSTGQMDQATFDAVKVDGGVILKEYIVQHYVHPTNDMLNSFSAECPGAVPVGTYLRCKYTATNTGGTRDVIINYAVENKD
jgi:hypothetical protein